MRSDQRTHKQASERERATERPNPGGLSQREEPQGKRSSGKGDAGREVRELQSSPLSALL